LGGKTAAKPSGPQVIPRKEEGRNKSSPRHEGGDPKTRLEWKKTGARGNRSRTKRETGSSWVGRKKVKRREVGREQKKREKKILRPTYHRDHPGVKAPTPIVKGLLWETKVN